MSRVRVPSLTPKVRGVFGSWLVLRLLALVHLFELAVVLVRPNGLFTKIRQNHSSLHAGGGIDLVEGHQDLMRLMAGERGPRSGKPSQEFPPNRVLMPRTEGSLYHRHCVGPSAGIKSGRIVLGEHDIDEFAWNANDFGMHSRDRLRCRGPGVSVEGSDWDGALIERHGSPSTVPTRPD